ncbi:MAG: hypothetical protein IJ828_10670 [Treponema sp.]|nr:hypothetical protein [Treponema sp.]
MSLPFDEEIFNFTDFYIYMFENAAKTDYMIYEGNCKANLVTEFPSEKRLFTITIPPFCTGLAKLGVFLKDFSTLLNEMLVKWNRDTVQRFYTETMQKFFPEYVADYELGFYERKGFLYCTVQYTEEGHQKAFGRGWNGTSTAHEMMCDYGLPPSRLMFQEHDSVTHESVEDRLRKEIRRLKKSGQSTNLKQLI